MLQCAKNAWYRDGKWAEGKKYLQVSTDEVYERFVDGRVYFIVKKIIEIPVSYTHLDVYKRQSIIRCPR